MRAVACLQARHEGHRPVDGVLVNSYCPSLSRVELSTAFRDVSRCYARENISARRFARGVHIARSFVELRRDA